MVHSNAAQLIELFQDQDVQQFLTSFGDFVVGVLGKALEVVDLSPIALSLSTRRHSLCSSALEVVRAVNTLCELCYSGREEEILEEIRTRTSEGFQQFILDTARFPKITDFIQEMAVRFPEVAKQVNTFQIKCEALMKDCSEALEQAKAQQNREYWKRLGISCLALGGAAVTCYFIPPKSIKLAVTGAAGVITAYNMWSSNPHSEMERRIEQINTGVHKLSRVVVVIESKTHCGELDTERKNVHREAPQLSSVKNSITKMFRILSEVDITDQIAKIEFLLQSN